MQVRIFTVRAVIASLATGAVAAGTLGGFVRQARHPRRS